MTSAIDIVMASDIKEDDLLFRNNQAKGDAVATGEADSLYPFEVAAKVVEAQMRLEWVLLQITKEGGNGRTQVRMLP